MSVDPAPPNPPPTPALMRRSDADLLRAAVTLEASFLAEMLKSSGLGEGATSFGGGPGEDQFTSFLTDERARMMAEAGGIGLAQSIFEALKRGNDVG